MRAVVAAAPVLLALLLLAGCSGNPFWIHQPEPEKDARMLDLPDRAGIVVRPVEGVDGDRSAALTAALVAALQQANVPAGSGAGAGNRGSQVLSATVTPTAEGGAGGEGDVRIDLSWDLADHAGAPIGAGTGSWIVPAPAWRAAAPEAMADLAGEVAPRVAALIQNDPGRGVPASAPRRVHFAGLEGAPGNGAATLPRLVAYLLEQNGYNAVDTAEDAVSVAGLYQAEPAADNMETVAIQWRVTDSEGQEIGVVTQENLIPRGSLDGPWGDAAFYIAEGAVQGVHSLLVTGR